jgi:hypothetical protein
MPWLLHGQAARADIAPCLPSTPKVANMRSYPRNSPQAAARIVALVLIADGHVCRSEVDALNKLDAAQALGLEPDAFGPIVHTLCEDLLMCDYTGGSMLGRVDDSTIASLMSEVDAPLLRATVLGLAVAAARADSHLSEGEQLVLEAARHHWGLKDDMTNAVQGAAARDRAQPLAEAIT